MLKKLHHFIVLISLSLVVMTFLYEIAPKNCEQTDTITFIGTCDIFGDCATIDNRGDFNVVEFPIIGYTSRKCELDTDSIINIVTWRF